jgi:YfiH family protein
VSDNLQLQLQRELWRSDLLASLPGVIHGVTRRVPGLGRAGGNIGFRAPRDKRDAWEMRQRWCAAADLSAKDLVTLGQVHGANVHVVAARHAGWGAQPGSGQIGLGDALVTGEWGPVLLTLHADCQPVLFVVPQTGSRGPIVAVAHAGWRGTVAGVVRQTLEVMRDEFGAPAADVHVALGPAIGQCCYEVGEDVATAWRDVAGAEASGALANGNGRYRFGLTAANLLLLLRTGVRPEHIDVSPICTRCDGDRWFSHRGQGAETGRFGAMIALAPASKDGTA